MPSDVPRNFAAARRMPYENYVFQIQFFDEFSKIVRVVIMSLPSHG
jgi:hypothetical protein